MKLYDFVGAPNPRRVQIFLAEKGVQVPLVSVNLKEREQFSDWFRAINPQCMVPFLQLDDGTGIGEVEAICRYIEEAYPDKPLLGSDPKSKAVIAMWEHRVEWEGFGAATEAFRNRVAGFVGHAVAGPVGFEQIPELADRGKQRVAAFYDMLDARLAESPFIAGDDFSIADITAFVTTEFAAWSKIRLPEGHEHLKAWHAKVSARPSVAV